MSWFTSSPPNHDRHDHPQGAPSPLRWDRAGNYGNPTSRLATATVAHRENRRRRVTSNTGTLRMVAPRRRRSSIAAVPTNNDSVTTWTVETIRYAYRDSWSAMLPAVDASGKAVPSRFADVKATGRSLQGRRSGSCLPHVVSDAPADDQIRVRKEPQMLLE